MRPARKVVLTLLCVPVVLLAALALYPEAPPHPSGAWMQRAGVSARRLQVGELGIRYVRRGRGTPVVLVHGFSSSMYTWGEVLPVLARDHDVIAFDLPGFGGSDVPARFEPEASAELISRVMDGLGIPRASLAGNSLGGALSALTAARHPERVDRLVLVDSAGYNLAPADRPRILRAMMVLGGLLDPFPQRPIVRMGLKQVFYDDSLITDEKVEEYFAPIARPGARRAARALLGGGHELGLPAALGRIRAPTLVVWGAEDEWIPLRDADRFVRDIPGARKVVLERCGHVAQEERPQEVARLISDFLAGP